MNIENSNLSNHEISKAISLGERLQQARKILGLSQQKIADCLCVKLSVIKGIEEDCIDTLGIGSTFLCGYIRSYARLVGVENEEILISSCALYSSISSMYVKKRFKKNFSWKRCIVKNKLLTIIIFCILFIFVTAVLFTGCLKYFFLKKDHVSIFNFQVVDFFIYKQDKKNLSFFSEKYHFNQSVNIFCNDSFYFVDYVHNLSFFLLCYLNEFDQILNGIKNCNLYEDIIFFYLLNDININNIINDNSTYVSNKNILIMSFTSDCWIKVSDATGKILCVGTQSVGNNLSVKGEIPYELIIGAPNAIKLEYHGNIIDLKKFIYPNRVTRVSIPN